MAEDLPFLLREQARDRLERYRAEHAADAGADSAVPEPDHDTGLDEDRVGPGPEQIAQEVQRLRHAAEIAEASYQRAEAEGTLG